MTSDWKAGFHRALVDAIVQEGSPHDPNRSPYWGSSLPDNWQEVTSRVAATGIDYANTSKPIEAEWEEFGGTFHEGDNRKYGVDLELALLDGTRTWYRYSGTISTLILAVATHDDWCTGGGQRWVALDGDRRCPVCHITRRTLARVLGSTSTYQVPKHAKEA